MKSCLFKICLEKKKKKNNNNNNNLNSTHYLTCVAAGKNSNLQQICKQEVVTTSKSLKLVRY